MNELSPPPATISVVIPTYNRRDSLEVLLADVSRQTLPPAEVIVVDDNSTDDTAEIVGRRFPAVIYRRNPTNLGPAAARSRGVLAATGTIIVGLDSDVTLPDPTLFLRISETFAAEPAAAALALRVMSSDGNSDDGPRWCHPFPIPEVADKWFWSDYFSGTGYAFRRQAMIAAGLFPEVFFMHHEEVELAHRTIDGGGGILHCPDLTLRHHPHPVADRNRVDIYFNPRNHILLAIGLYPAIHAAYYLATRLTYQFCRALGRRHLGSYFLAVRDAIALAPVRLKSRRPVSWAALRRIRSLRRRPHFHPRSTGPGR